MAFSIYGVRREKNIVLRIMILLLFLMVMVLTQNNLKFGTLEILILLLNNIKMMIL